MSGFKDNLSYPFERPETENQRKLHNQIRSLCKQGFVVEMSYPELFDVMARVKLSFQLDMCKRMKLITFNKKKFKAKVKE